MDRRGCGLWVVDRRGWVVVVDRRGWVVVVDRRAEVGCGRGWVVAEVAPVMIFFEWVCSGGFQIVVGSWSWFALVVFGFQIGSGDDFF